jgi:hypothetical protein
MGGIAIHGNGVPDLVGDCLAVRLGNLDPFGHNSDTCPPDPRGDGRRDRDQIRVRTGDSGHVEHTGCIWHKIQDGTIEHDRQASDTGHRIDARYTGHEIQGDYTQYVIDAGREHRIELEMDRDQANRPQASISAELTHPFLPENDAR